MIIMQAVNRDYVARHSDAAVDCRKYNFKEMY